jgi:hypothetical protein
MGDAVDCVEFVWEVFRAKGLHIPWTDFSSPGNIYEDAFRKPWPAKGAWKALAPSFWWETLVPGHIRLPFSLAERTLRFVASRDPNVKVGPSGFDTAFHFAAPRQPFEYFVYFENDSAATAPAESVWIADTLDSDLDWSTLQLGEIFPGAGPDSIRPAYNSVTNFDPVSGVITWGLYNINLPPDTAPYWGEGWVSYSVRPKPNLPTGTRIENIAAIKFDVNDWILAPMDSVPIFNTIDAGTPTSNVSPLPDTVVGLVFPVCWAGADDSAGSGISAVDVYFSKDGGPYDFWTRSTASVCSTYTAPGVGTYTFYSVARDNVGHVEAVPLAPDAITHVVLPPCDCAKQGDIDGNGYIDVFDVIYVIGIAFSGGTDPKDPQCPATRGDVDNSGVVDVFDVIYLIAASFSGGPMPVSPCGP